MRVIWFIVGIVATGCGIVGIVLPLMPTTPFLLVATYAFARSSPALHDWLVTHPHLGPPIRDWRLHGAIDARTKVGAVAVMLAMLTGSWLAGLGTMLLLVQASVLAAVALFILTRPSAPKPRA